MGLKCRDGAPSPLSSGRCCTGTLGERGTDTGGSVVREAAAHSHGDGAMQRKWWSLALIGGVG